jgi:hypothetical protein
MVLKYKDIHMHQSSHLAQCMNINLIDFMLDCYLNFSGPTPKLMRF